jgi:SAM-dependent methyltransferase
VSDAANLALLRRWLTPDPRARVLKTDLFDELVSEGLLPWLSASFGQVTGMDISPALVGMVRERHPGVQAEAVDVRELPFTDGSFDLIVSNSTLDHLASREEITLALRELHRVLRPGGQMLVTLDNPLNPAVALRNILPARIRTAIGLTPYSIGATLGPRGLREQLRRTGFEVVRSGALFHCPRFIVVVGGRLVDRLAGPRTRRGFVRLWTSFEALDALPSRYVTGHFVAALARKA